jgi:glycosyltransferase involved in cell wall biosynthesis
MNTSQGFFYISDSRFLFTRYDQGEFELHFLKAKNKKIVQWFCGSDIRSVVLSKSIQLKSDYETFADVIPLISPYVLTDEYDFKKKLIARVTDRYADLIFTNEIDQISYLMSPALNTSPIIGEEYFSFNPDKFTFSAGKKIQVVHVASNVFIKGTPLVMSAVNRLKKEGFDFDFHLLTAAPKSEVIAKLQEAHIVLGQFYSRTSGHSGAEALANTTIVLQSVSKNNMNFVIEPWVETYSYEVYENLKKVLINISEYIDVAVSGYDFATANFHIFSVAKELKSQLKKLERIQIKNPTR